MCGIYGIIFHGTDRPVNVINTAAQLFSTLAMASAERGTDATGLARIDSDGYVAQYKNCKPSYKVVEFNRWWRPLFNISPATVAVLGHTRFGTHGANTKDNAHPFVYKTPDGIFVGTHNGVISNHQAYGPVPALDNDSANLFYGLATRGPDRWIETLEDVRGSFALVFSLGARTYLAKNDGSPCHTSYIEELHATAYASTAAILRESLEACKLKATTPTSTRSGVLYTYEPGTQVPQQTAFAIEDLYAWSGRRYWSRPTTHYTKEYVQDDQQLSNNSVIICDRCGQEDFWQFACVLDSGATLCFECEKKARAAKSSATLFEESVQCGGCGMLTPLSDMAEDTPGGEFVCRTCESERVEALEQLGKQLCCKGCDAEFGEEDVDTSIMWFDSINGYLCEKCFAAGLGSDSDVQNPDDMADCAAGL